MRKRISLSKLLDKEFGGLQDIPYEQQYRHISELLAEGKIIPLKASGTNGKRPALCQEYWLIEPEKDYHVYEEELKYKLHPLISIDYYLAHLKSYEQDRTWVLRLSEYLKKNRESLNYQESVNERSFEIWGREKFLNREQGGRILKRCGMEIDFLNIYQTTEPLACYSHTREVPQNMLILENKDTFYSMRRHLLDGNDRILGIPIGTLIYGAGKGILRSFQDFELCVEPYMKDKRNDIFYFGDLDYEGIGIFERLAEIAANDWKLIPFAAAYDAMLKKAGKKEELPDTKEKQNRNIGEKFFSYFAAERIDEMKRILECDKYIPQEILNIADFGMQHGKNVFS